MTTEITADTDLDALAQRIGVGEAEELRSSRSRREPHLQKYTRLLGGMTDIDLTLNPNLAAADMEAGRDIYIPTREFNQSQTDIPESMYDLLAQEMLSTHEVGHLLYSDWPSLKEEIDSVGEFAKDFDNSSGDAEDWKAVYKELWNAAEDGVIENELGKAFVVESEFEILNANLSAEGTAGELTKLESGDEEYIYYMKDACTQAFLDISVYDSGTLDRLMDDTDGKHTFYVGEDANRFREALDDFYDVIEEMKNTPQGDERNDVFFDFFIDTVVDLLQNADVSGLRNADEGDVTQYGRSDDAHEGIEGSQKELEYTPGGEGQEDTQGGGQGSEEDDMTEEVTSQYEDAMEEEARQAVGGSLLDEVEEFQQILEQGGRVDIDSFYIPEEKTIHQDTRKQARRVGRQIKPIIENQLRESKLNAYSRGRASGELDPRAMMDAERGSVRVFQRQQNGNEKDYSITLLLDRSGSMMGSIEDTEVSIGAFMFALEDLGVDTMCLDFCGNRLRLAKPFGQSVTESAGTLFTGEAGGGTPLSDGLHYARRRVEDGSGTNPAIMVVTDGGAGHREKYLDELRQCNVPVIGLYLMQGKKQADVTQIDDRSNFHRFRAVTSDKGLVTSLQRLSREVML